MESATEPGGADRAGGNGRESPAIRPFDVQWQFAFGEARHSPEAKKYDAPLKISSIYQNMSNGKSGSRHETLLAISDQRRFSASSSSKVRGQSAPSSRDRARSASTLPPVWHLAQ